MALHSDVKNCLNSIVYYYNGAQDTSSSYRSVDCIGLWSYLV